MTPEEKFWQLYMIPGGLSEGSEKYKHGIFGFQVNTAAKPGGAAAQLLSYSNKGHAVQMAHEINEMQHFFLEQSRLAIPVITFDEALHGLLRAEATVYPQAIALAATWDTLLMGQVARAIAKETKSRGIRQILTPVVNIASDVRRNRFKKYTYDQIEELMTGYGPVDILWLDGGWVRPKHTIDNGVEWQKAIPYDQDIDMAAIAKMGRSHQPGLLVVDRTVSGEYENYVTPKQSIPAGYLPYPWESCMPLGDSWSYVPNDHFSVVAVLPSNVCRRFDPVQP
ncbi:MAG: hypothetical protein NVS3B8_03680 [Chitinophagaceae bacterium]